MPAKKKRAAKQAAGGWIIPPAVAASMIHPLVPRVAPWLPTFGAALHDFGGLPPRSLCEGCGAQSTATVGDLFDLHAPGCSYEGWPRRFRDRVSFRLPQQVEARLRERWAQGARDQCPVCGAGKNHATHEAWCNFEEKEMLWRVTT